MLELDRGHREFNLGLEILATIPFSKPGIVAGVIANEFELQGMRDLRTIIKELDTKYGVKIVWSQRDSKGKFGAMRLYIDKRSRPLADHLASQYMKTISPSLYGHPSVSLKSYEMDSYGEDSNNSSDNDIDSNCETASATGLKGGIGWTGDLNSDLA